MNDKTVNCYFRPQFVPGIGAVELKISAMLLKPSGEDDAMVQGTRLTEVKDDRGCFACIVRVEKNGELRADWNPHKERWQIPRNS